MRLAIIGAGMAGLAAARLLRQRRPDLSLALFEQSGAPGGRIVTGRRDGFAFDHGAQYVKTPTPELERLLTSELPADDLRDIGRPVWTFDRSGTIVEGDRLQNADPKWIYHDGLDRLGRLMAEGLDVRYGICIGRVRQVAAGQTTLNSAGFELFDRDGARVGAADAVLFTAPAPQTAALLMASELDPTVQHHLLAELKQASYRPCLSLALAYDQSVERPFYALVNTDRGHPISWLALEHAKGPERCPAGFSLLLVQMAAQFSREAWDLPLEVLTTQVAGHVRALLGDELPDPLWCDVLRWRHALPDTGADFQSLNQINARLFFAGDYTAGQGRVHLAIESGLRVGGLIAASLG